MKDVGSYHPHQETTPRRLPIPCPLRARSRSTSGSGIGPAHQAEAPRMNPSHSGRRGLKSGSVATAGGTRRGEPRVRGGGLPVTGAQLYCNCIRRVFGYSPKFYHNLNCYVMPRNDTTVLVSRFLPGSERCANELIADSGRPGRLLTSKGQPLQVGANFLLVGTGISERVRVTGSLRHRARCRLLLVSGNGRHGDCRIDHDTVFGKEPPQGIGSTHLIGESKKDALQATRQLLPSGRTLPAADYFMGFPVSLKRPGRAGTTPVPVRLLPTTINTPTPCRH